MSEILPTPPLEGRDRQVVAQIHDMRRELSQHLRAPARWQGGLRRTLQARAVRGSNTIEGYTVSVSDAIAAMDADAPLTADEATWAEIMAYRRVLTYVLHVSVLPGFVIDAQTLRTMHFMLLEHELRKSPGQYRSTEIYVHDDRSGSNVYQGPPPERVPALMEALVTSLASRPGDDALVAAAMAHLNLVMIHPFRDGNGRMARILQTMVLARDRVVSPEFSSIEEWLGRNTDAYYRILASTGQGGWHPERDALPWVRFNLRAHHMQAQTARRRVREAELVWAELDLIQARHRLPESTSQALFDAHLGGRVTRASYADRAGVDVSTASRHLQGLTERELLEARGQTKGRHYVAGPALVTLRRRLVEARLPLDDPYPDLGA